MSITGTNYKSGVKLVPEVWSSYLSRGNIPRKTHHHQHTGLLLSPESINSLAITGRELDPGFSCHGVKKVEKILKFQHARSHHFQICSKFLRSSIAWRPLDLHGLEDWRRSNRCNLQTRRKTRITVSSFITTAKRKKWCKIFMPQRLILAAEV